MWAALLGGLLGQGVKSPQQIQVNQEEQNSNIALYGFAAVVLIVFAIVFINLNKK